MCGVLFMLWIGTGGSYEGVVGQEAWGYSDLFVYLVEELDMCRNDNINKSIISGKFTYPVLPSSAPLFINQYFCQRVLVSAKARLIGGPKLS